MSNSPEQRADDAPEVTPLQRKSGGRGRRLLSNLLILVGVALLATAGVLWGQVQWRYHKQAQANQKVQAYVKPSTTATKDEEPRGPQVDWEGLKAVNDDIVGWLEIPGTVISYPVYQGEDNEHYLHATAEGDWTVGGQLFMDCDGTAPGMVDGNTLIYGHHLIDGTMFKKVAEMDSQEVFDEVDTVWYVTEQKSYELEPLLLYYTTPTDAEVRQFTFEQEVDFDAYLADRLARAVTQREDARAAARRTKHMLSLITCNYYDGFGRTVLLCVPKDEANDAA